MNKFDIQADTIIQLPLGKSRNISPCIEAVEQEPKNETGTKKITSIGQMLQHKYLTILGLERHCRGHAVTKV